MRQITFAVVRIGAMVALAMLLILGLLPAILSVEAGRHLGEHTTSRRLGARDDPAALDCDGRVADQPNESVSDSNGQTGPRRLGVAGSCHVRRRMGG